MRRVLSGMAAIALTCAATTAAMAQTAPPEPQTPVNGSVTTGGQMQTNPNVQTAPMTPGAPTTENLNGPNMVPVHDATWQYQLMAKQYHWSAPPSSGKSQ